MTAVMQGVRILEVAEHTFVPAASALLADWGAEVIKIEHVERGDAMRGLMSTGVGDHGHRRPRAPRALEPGQEEPRARPHLRRGPRRPLQAGRHLRRVPHQQAPERARRSCSIDVDDIRAHNPPIIYVRGTGQGERGPDADKGSYDVLSYWHRPGMSLGTKHPDDDHVPPPPAPAFGDSIGAMTIAGGIMGALFHRERTGEATTVDVSLLGIGIWSMGAALALSLQLGMPWPPPPPAPRPATRSSRPTATKDGRSSPSPACRPAALLGRGVRDLGRPELADDERFADAAAIMANAAEARRPARRGVRRAHRRRVARAARRLHRPVDRRAGHHRGRGRPADASPTATSSTARRPTAPRSSWPRRRCSSTRSRPSPPGARVQRARRRDPRRARPRQGRDHRPQGPRRRRLTSPPTTSTRRSAHMGLFDAFRYDGQARPRRRRRHRHGRRRRRGRARRRRRGGGHGPRRGHPRRRQGHLASTWPTPRRSTPPSTSSAGRSTPSSPAPASPTARPASRRSTSSATAT